MSAVATATIILEPSVPEKAKRSRKTHHKVRTGCITCKIRRKKCDEAKPHCNRCTSTGRKCDGYETIEAEAATEGRPTKQARPSSKPDSPDSGIDVSYIRTKSITQSPPTALISSRSNSRSLTPASERDVRLLRNPSSILSLTKNTFDSPEDHYSFTFFQHRTGPEFAAYFDSSIWRNFMLRACFQHPAVLAAASAVGAVHRRFELGITPEAFAFCDIADRQYDRAVKLLSADLASKHPSAPEISMLSHLLLSVFQSFQDNDDKALEYMTEGLNYIFTRPTITTHRESRYKAVHVGYSPLFTFISRLEKLAATRSFFGRPFTTLSDPAINLEPTPMPTAFTSLHEARDYLFTESLWIWQAWNSLTLGTNSGSFAQQHRHIARLLQWSMSYAEFTKSDAARQLSSPSSSSSSSSHTTSPHSHSPSTTRSSSSSPKFGDTYTQSPKRQSHLLKTYREALYLTLLTQLALHDESSGQAIIPRCFPPESCDCHRSCRDYAERKSALNAHFARLLVLAEGLFSQQHDTTNGGGGGANNTSSATSSSSSPSWAYDSEHSLSIDTGIGPPLWAGGGGGSSSSFGSQRDRHCRSTKVRHQVVGLLGEERLRAEVWGKMGVYAIAEKLSAVEEHAIARAGGLAGIGAGRRWSDAYGGGNNNYNNNNTNGGAFRDDNEPFLMGGMSQLDVQMDGEVDVEDLNGWFRGQPNWMAGTRGLGDVKWCDYTCFLEEGRLLVRYCQEDELGGLVWTQEWVKFR